MTNQMIASEKPIASSRGSLTAPMLPLAKDSPPVRWRESEGLVEYERAVEEMERIANGIRNGSRRETIWLLEHPPLYSAGVSAAESDLIDSGGIPVFRTGRGGKHSYHGPGQRIAYVMLDLNRRRRDVRGFVAALEDWIIASLAELDVKGERRQDRVGVWVSRSGGREDKIAAIGIRLRRWVSLHGIAINVSPNLSHYSGIIPCGVRDHGITSLSDLGAKASMRDLDEALKRNFEPIFGPVEA